MRSSAPPSIDDYPRHQYTFGAIEPNTGRTGDRLAGQATSDIHLDIFCDDLEIRFGLQTMPVGTRRAVLMRAFETALADKIGHRFASFDTAAAQQAGDLMGVRYKKGRPGELRDTMIAGIVLACHATLATRNASHFEDLLVPVINPWVS
jgi:hypothetical protein